VLPFSSSSDHTCSDTPKTLIHTHRNMHSYTLIDCLNYFIQPTNILLRTATGHQWSKLCAR